MNLCDLKHPDVAALPRTTPIIIPLGALEQHGPHLPLFTDSFLCGEVARRAGEAAGRSALFTPLMWLGSSSHHLEFAGTMTAGPRTYQDLLGDLLETFIAQGFSRLLFLNGHGGNVVPCQQALFEAKQRHRGRPELLLLATPYWALGTRPETLGVGIRQTGMGHACEWETSMMLRLAPQLVGDYRNAPPVSLEEGLFFPAARGWNTHERSSAGHVGDPREASAEKGEVMLRAFTGDVVSLVEKMASWDGRSWG